MLFYQLKTRLFAIGVSAFLMFAAGCAPSHFTDLKTDYILAASNLVGDIFQIDEADASATLLKNTSTDGSTDVGVISSMVYFPTTGVLWIGGGGSTSRSTCAGCVVNINPATGVVTTLADNYAAMRAITGMTIDSSGNIYAGGRSKDIYELSSESGLPTLFTHTFPSVGAGGGGLTIGADGNLYTALDGDASTGGVLFMSNPASLTGTNATNVGIFSLVGITPASTTYSSVLSMATRPSDGTIFAILRDGFGRSAPHYIVTVNPATAVLTYVGTLPYYLENSTSINYHDGLVFIQDTLFTQ